MKLTLSAFALAALLAAVPAHATVFGVSFTGTVIQTQGATGQAVNNTVSGQFDLDSATGNFSDFTIAGKSVAPGFQSSADIGPAETDAIYMAQLSPVSTGGTNNSSFMLDLSSLTNWPSYDNAYGLLSDASQLPGNLDTVNNPLSAFPSTFGYYTSNSNGTNVVSLTADLTSLAVTTPEPASLGLLAGSLLGLGLMVLRRRV